MFLYDLKIIMLVIIIEILKLIIDSGWLGCDNIQK